MILLFVFICISTAMELLLLLLLIKHAVVDLYLQCFHPTMNKRAYFGGWPHYLEHAVFTLLICCAFFSFEIAFMLAAIDGVLHWHIDYTKHVVQTRWNITPNGNKELYWFIQCVDQSLHFITYYVLVVIGLGLS